MRKFVYLLLTVSLFALAGCSQNRTNSSNNSAENSYRQISQEEAKEMMEKDDGHVIVDVRRQDEYDAGHIPGAILIPNESIGTEKPEELPDLNQIILVYCRSGNRSKQASQKLADMGYTNVFEFGGINSWTGEIVTGEASDVSIWTETEMPVHLRYDRMWEYSDYAETDDPERIASVVNAIKSLMVGERVDYSVDDFTDLLTFTFEDGRELSLQFEEYTWVKEPKERYHVEDLKALRSLLNELMES